jgi:hypothetical protein
MSGRGRLARLRRQEARVGPRPDHPVAALVDFEAEMVLRVYYPDRSEEPAGRTAADLLPVLKVYGGFDVEAV